MLRELTGRHALDGPVTSVVRTKGHLVDDEATVGDEVLNGHRAHTSDEVRDAFTEFARFVVTLFAEVTTAHMVPDLLELARAWKPDLIVRDVRIDEMSFDLRFWRDGPATLWEVLKGDPSRVRPLAFASGPALACTPSLAPAAYQRAAPAGPILSDVAP